jgi:hypothetical protein
VVSHGFGNNFLISHPLHLLLLAGSSYREGFFVFRLGNFRFRLVGFAIAVLARKPYR